MPGGVETFTLAADRARLRQRSAGRTRGQLPHPTPPRDAERFYAWRP